MFARPAVLPDAEPSIHLHGGHVEATSDGYPTDVIATGTAKGYVYPNRQIAATLSYHDHQMERTGPDVWMGLSVPIEDALGDVILVNGVAQPRFEVANRRYRTGMAVRGTGCSSRPPSVGTGRGRRRLLRCPARLPGRPAQPVGTPAGGLRHNEVWRLENRAGMPHPMHIHLDMFQILDRDGAPPAEGESGRKDTVAIGPHETVRVIVRFTHFTGRYMAHCHNLEHEDDGMMARFEVAPA
jgi:FtsP/CotA-like multicopper oxidase with cupredoxin domain